METKPLNLAYDDFAKLDIRTGTITKAEAVPKSKKLLKLEVFFGAEVGTRTIMAGIASSYDVEAIIGQRVVAVLNLAPRALMGVQSDGMLLAGHNQDGAMHLCMCSVPDGTSIG